MKSCNICGLSDNRKFIEFEDNYYCSNCTELE